MLKRLCSAFLSLAMAMGLVTALSGTASATNYSVIDWNVSRITDGGAEHAIRYFRLMDEIHRRSYGEPTEEENVTQTTTEAGRLIQVRVLDTNNEHVASVYIWADNLYVAGFYSPRSNTHWAFHDREQQFQQALGVSARFMPNTGNYNSLPGGNDRQNLVFTPNSMYNAMRQLNNVTSYNDNVGRALLVATQIFSESARFAPILNRVYGNIISHQANALGDGYAGLENQWGAISQFAYNLRHGQPASINILGRVITSFAALRQLLGFVELNGSQARL
ncbi:ribosome-inactivating family protein [Streptomyces sp. NPDC059382]|uniref:ribosome-inactivating family protein n=1 Tax=Streptomyces sp. NPDC059382 TaxID=3346816 RepID=UPI0036A6C9B5